MNKRISTLFASFLLMAGAVFAAGETTPAKTYEALDKVTNGEKVYLGADPNEDTKVVTSFLKSEEVKNVGYGFTTVDEAGAEVFTVSGKKTENGTDYFQLLNAAGKVIYGTTSGDVVGTPDADAVKKGYCWFTFAEGVIKLGNKPLAYDMSSSSKVAKMLKASKETTADDLNKNLSGKGFSFKFPKAASEPDVNPFGEQMFAIDAATVNEQLELGVESVSGVCFVVANDAGLKLAKSDGKTKDNLKAATFIVLNPNAIFGITSLDATQGEGFGFTTVKGEKLNSTNVKKDGKIAFVNAIYSVSEKDLANKGGQYTVQMKGVKVTKDTDENHGSNLNVYVGAYSLTAGGLKTYITTKKDEAKLTLAQTTGDTWAKASDLLKTDGAAIYNIYFTGTQPESGKENESLYGKYLVSKYAAKVDVARTNSYSFVEEAVAPKDVDLKAPSAQWVVIAMPGMGSVTFKNLETSETFKANLYKTDKAGIYQAVSTTVGELTAENIKLVAVSGNEGFLNLTDAQLKQKAQLVFNGKSTVAVDKLYMYYNDDAKKKQFEPISDVAKSYSWAFEKAESVKNNFKYIYLKDDAVAEKEADMLIIQAYYLVDGDNGFKHDTDNSKYALAEHKDKKSEKLSRLVFKKNVDGTYSVICLDSELNAEKAADNYNQVVKAGAKRLYVDVTEASFSEDLVGADKSYTNVTVDFYQLGISLEATPRHATLDGDEGSISLKENKNGILEGVIGAEGLTFWLDTADSKAEIPSFYISKGIATEEPVTKAEEPAAVTRNFLYYAKDSMYFWNESKAKFDVNANYALEGSYSNDPTEETDVKAIFRPAVLAGVDTINTTVNGKAVVVAKETKENVCSAGIDNFKFYITKIEGGYSVTPVGAATTYLYALNGKLGFTTNASKALPLTVGEGNPTSNESIDNSVSSSIVVTGNAGYVTIQGAQGETAYVRNLLGMPLAETVITSDDATIAVPAGIVLVTVGEETVKVVVK